MVPFVVIQLQQGQSEVEMWGCWGPAHLGFPLVDISDSLRKGSQLFRAGLGADIWSPGPETGAGVGMLPGLFRAANSGS